MTNCLQEDCFNWDGHSCVCETLDVEPQYCICISKPGYNCPTHTMPWY